MRVVWPALLSLAVCTAYVSWRLAAHEWDPVGLAELGSHFSEGAANGSYGYDGQFAYYMALDLAPERVAVHLDVPSYRYQRILYPWVARAMSLGRPEWIPWGLVLTNLASGFAATWIVARILADHGQRPAYALSFGLWVGLVAAAGTDLNEPLAFALIAGAWLARGRNRLVLSAGLLGLSLFAKETSVLFWCAALAQDLIARRWRSALALASAGAAFIGWQLWLLGTFGSLGLGSGGALSTPFEWVPLMGLLRIGTVSLPALGLFLIIFGPSILLPTIWGIVASLRSFGQRDFRVDAWALLFNSAAILFLPFSTFREPLGLVRFADGLVLSTLLYSASRGLRRPLNYSLFWIGLLAILLNH